MEIGVLGGGAVDGAFAAPRAYIGPEFIWSRLFGDFGGVTAGHMEEPGLSPGRSVYVQAQIRPFAGALPVLWHVRANYLENRANVLASHAELGTQKEMWFSAWLNALLFPNLQLQARVRGLFPMLEPDGFGAQQNGMWLNVSVSGAL